MSSFDRVLRWYPAKWRERYGEELAALLEDTYGPGPVPLRCRASLARAGILERLRGPRRTRDDDGYRQRVRSGALLVLCAWAVFIVAGAGFAKFTEHWDMATPAGERRVPAGAYGAVQWAAFLGTVIVLASAVLCLPALLGLVRRGGWADIRRPVTRAVVASAATVLGGVVVAAWAHHLPARGRNGGVWPFVAVGTTWVVMIVASLALCAAAVVAVVRRLHLGGSTLRAQGVLALAMTTIMVVVTAGTVTWWASVARVAPGFLGNGPGGAAGGLVPPAMVVTGGLMVVGLALAVLGAGWVAGSLARLPPDPPGP